MFSSRRKIFWMAWAIALVCAGLLYYSRTHRNAYVGIVKARTHIVTSVESGVIEKLHVAEGDTVRAGQPVARVSLADLQTAFDEIRLLIDMDQLEKGFRDEISQIESERAELSSINSRLKNLKAAQAKGLVSAQALTDMIIRQHLLQKKIYEHLKALRRQLETTPDDQVPPIKSEKGNMDDQGVRIETLRDRLSELLKQIHQGNITAPSDGEVTEIFAFEGDTVTAFAPILQIEQTPPEFVEFFISEHTPVDVTVGDRVSLHNPGNMQLLGEGTVFYLLPGFVQVPERLSVMTNKGPAWARKYLIRPDKPQNLSPNAKLFVKFEKSAMNRSALPNTSLPTQANASEKPVDTKSNDEPTPIKVPPSLAAISRFEPSGLVWLKEAEKFLVISDDTGFKQADNHAPWLFFMDADKNVADQPRIIAGAGEINDLESVTLNKKGDIFLISSCGKNKKGQRPENRGLLTRVRYENGEFRMTGSLNLFALLRDYCSAGECVGLAGDLGAKVILDKLNIEGAAIKNGSLFLGLKEPQGPIGALLWVIRDFEKLFDKPTLEPGQIALAGEIKLQNTGDAPRGISDLAFDDKGRLLVLSTNVGVTGEAQTGALDLVEDLDKSPMSAQRIAVFPGLKPEGIAKGPSGEWIIVFDQGQKSPLLAQIKLQ